MDRVTAKCKDCIYCEDRDYTKQERESRPYDPPDGYCTKIFPRGYVGAGKPGGPIYKGKSTCFQFVPRGT